MPGVKFTRRLSTRNYDFFNALRYGTLIDLNQSTLIQIDDGKNSFNRIFKYANYRGAIQSPKTPTGLVRCEDAVLILREWRLIAFCRNLISPRLDSFYAKAYQLAWTG